MKKIFALCCILFAIYGTAPAAVKAYLSYAKFYSPEKGPYLETYLSVSGGSVKYVKSSNEKFQAAIEVSLSFKKDGQLKYADKYNLLSPESDQPEQAGFSFMDMQRISLTNGDYEFELTIRDKNSADPPFSSKQLLRMDIFPNVLSVSDIVLLEKYSVSNETHAWVKHGMELIPRVFDFYPRTESKLKFYAEIYNAKSILGESPFLINYYIEQSETKRTVEKFKAFKKETPQEVNVLMSEFPIDELPSGNYNLVIELRNRQNDLLAAKYLFFQRSNTAADEKKDDFTLVNPASTFAAQYTSQDTLMDHVLSLRPISNSREQLFEDNQLRMADVEMMQKFLYHFWQKRNPENPELAWQKYHAEVRKVNDTYSTLTKRGYETERGRVYLQYGPPNSIAQSLNEPSAYPYEIWHYYKIDHQTNRKFVFYNPDLVTNDYTLLHSDALGEPYESRWELLLHKRNTQSRNYDSERGNDHFGEKSKDIFSNPR